jgi:hypothetical protein
MELNRKTLTEIAEEWSKAANFGSNEEPTKISQELVERDIDEVRAMVLSSIYSPMSVNPSNKPMRLNDQWTQAPILSLSATQPEFLDLPFCYYVYDCPQVITLNNNKDGFLSVAGVTQIGSSQTGYKLYRLTGAEQWRLMAQGKNVPRSYWWYQDGQLCITKRLPQVKVRAIFASPYQVRTYDIDTKTYSYMLNPETDAYPISGDVLRMMFEYWIKSKGQILMGGQKDTTDNGSINN